MLVAVDAQMTPGLGFEEIYKTHYRRVFNLCRYLLNSFDRAEDAAHEVFLRAHARIDSYNPALPLSSWILKIAGNYCIDVLRRKSTERRIFDLDSGKEMHAPALSCSPLSEVLAAERGEDVRRAIAGIPEKYRAPLVLAYYNELGYDEISEILGVERKQVALLIFRGKQQLRERLTKRQGKEKTR